MNREGACFPNQATIAKASRLSERSVRRQLRQAAEGGWLSREFMHRGGHASRNHFYRATVPDHVALDERDENLSEGLEARTEPGRADTQMSERQQRPATMMAAPSGRADTQMSAPQSSAPTCGHSDAQRPAKSEERPAIQSNDRTSRCPPNSSVLTLQSELTKSEARSEPAIGRVTSTRGRRAPEPESIEERERKAIVMLTSFPNATAATLAPYKLTAERISELRLIAAVAPPALAQTA
jgi:hypothetical protein